MDCVTIVWQTEKEKDQAEQEKLQNVQLKEKRGTRKKGGAKPCVHKIIRIKNIPMLNYVKEVVTSVQDFTQLIFQMVTKKYGKP